MVIAPTNDIDRPLGIQSTRSFAVGDFLRLAVCPPDLFCRGIGGGYGFV